MNQFIVPNPSVPTLTDTINEDIIWKIMRIPRSRIMSIKIPYVLRVGIGTYGFRTLSRLIDIHEK